MALPSSLFSAQISKADRTFILTVESNLTTASSSRERGTQKSLGRITPICAASLESRNEREILRFDGIRGLVERRIRSPTVIAMIAATLG